LNTDATGNPEMDRYQYLKTPEKQRVDPNALQYSSRTLPREQLQNKYLDPYARAPYKMDTDLSSSRSAGSGSYISDGLNLKPTYDRLTNSRAESQHADYSQTSSSQNQYTHRAATGSLKDPVAVNSSTVKRHSAATGYESKHNELDGNHGMNENLYSDRKMPNDKYYSTQKKYPVTKNAAQYSLAERHSPSMEVETARSRIATASQKYLSPGEEDLRRTLYDKKYQMDAQAAVQKKQTQLLGDSRLHLSPREQEDLEQASCQGLDSARKGYGISHRDGIKSVDKRSSVADSTRYPAAAVASSSQFSQHRNLVKSTDSQSGRKQLTKPDSGRESGIERDQGYSTLIEKPLPRPAVKFKEDYDRDGKRDQELVSGRSFQNSTAVSARVRFQQPNDKQLGVDNKKPQSGVSSNSARKADGQASRHELSSSLLKMKEDLLRDQAKLDRQLRASDGHSQRSENDSHYISNIDLRCSGQRSSYVADDHLV